ncbi:unnamed protein product [Caenorhabditis bovis]|uniref:Palmitoyltransferase n=1 Tax=Caenorhabditis bovis TaxID=2654633 RepID=A0A8S1FAF0_9PELO|nr:unnamed protein product [Caenorhabditis bovis]
MIGCSKVYSLLERFSKNETYLGLRDFSACLDKVFHICWIVFSVFLISALFLIILPSELKRSESHWFIAVCAFLTLVFLINIEYHYYASRRKKIVEKPGKPGDAFCEKCDYWKGPRTHHCRSCDRCIYKMDHHCPWIGQCVGAHNIHHFVLFLFQLLSAAILFFVLFSSFWSRFFKKNKSKSRSPATFTQYLNNWRMFIRKFTRDRSLLSILIIPGPFPDVIYEDDKSEI